MLDNKEEKQPNNKGLMASSMKTEFSEINALGVLQQPIPQAWKKQLKKGNANLDYVSGDLVIRLLNKAFRNRWSFEIKESRIIQSQDKVYTDKRSGTKTVTPQGQVIQVLGSLSVPGWGVREQWGAQVLTGGSDVQEHAFKSASTDAMKKCASMFGVALDLYGMQGASELMIRSEDFLRDDEASFDKLKEQILEAQAQNTGQNGELESEDIQQQLNEQEEEVEKTELTTATLPPKVIEDIEHEAFTLSVEQAVVPSAQNVPAVEPMAENVTTIPYFEPEPEPVVAPVETPVGRWKDEDIKEMINLKKELNLQSNDELNVYVRQFMKNEEATIGKHITPGNVRDFITYVRSTMTK